MDRPPLIDEPLPRRKFGHMLSSARRFLGTPERLEQGRVTENIQKARVLYDSEDIRDDKLPVRENEVVYVWSLEGNWWLCENMQRQEGKVPRTFLELLPLNSASLKGYRFEDLPARAIKIKQNEIEIATNPAQEQTELGHGAFGRVCEGRWLGVVVAVKQSYANYLDENIKKDFQEEVEIMGKLRHSNIVALVAYTEDTLIPWLVMECMDRGTLNDYLGGRKADRKHIFLSFAVVCDININIVNGLRYLHSIGLVHRDIKPDNILLCSKDGNEHFAKIADFGLSRFCRDENSNTLSLKTLRSDKRMGTITHMAPELLGIAPYRYSNKTDIFSEGMILCESITHEAPYTDCQFPRDEYLYQRAVEKHVINGDRANIPKKAAPKAWWKLTRRCWAQNAEDRPEAEEVLEELLEIRKAYLSNSSSSSESPSSRETERQIELARQSNSLNINSEVSHRIGPMEIAEFELERAFGRRGGFYAAVGLQLQRTNRGFLVGLNIPEGSTLEDMLQSLIEGASFQAEEDRDKDSGIYRVAERSDSIVAIIDTRCPQLGFLCYFTDRNGERKKSYDVREVPTRRPIIRLADTGEHFLSVKEHPDLAVGGLRARFNSEALGGYSLASSTTRLSSSRLAFTTQMSSFRNSSSGTSSSFQIRTLSNKEKGKEEETGYSMGNSGR